jgi:hypothetical protein
MMERQTAREIIRERLWRDVDVKESMVDFLTDDILAALHAAGWRIVRAEFMLRLRDACIGQDLFGLAVDIDAAITGQEPE